MNTVERVAVDLAVRYEQSQGRDVTYVGEGWPAGMGSEVRAWARRRHGFNGRTTCDLVSRESTGSIARLIEVKGRRGPTSVSIVDRQREAMMALASDWWLYVALRCRSDAPALFVVHEPGRLPWELLTPASAVPGARGHGVDKEGVWHVPQSAVVATGDRVLPT